MKELKTLAEDTKRELAATIASNEAKSRAVESIRLTFQAQAAQVDVRRDQLKAQRDELDAMEGAITELDRADELRVVDEASKKLDGDAKKAQDDYEAAVKGLVDELNKIREVQRKLEGRVELHERLLKRVNGRNGSKKVVKAATPA